MWIIRLIWLIFNNFQTLLEPWKELWLELWLEFELELELELELEVEVEFDLDFVLSVSSYFVLFLSGCKIKTVAWCPSNFLGCIYTPFIWLFVWFWWSMWFIWLFICLLMWFPFPLFVW